MPIRTVLWLIGFSLCLPGWSQFFPSSASTRIYIGHFVDGGPAAQKWNTTLILTNPNAGVPILRRLAQLLSARVRLASEQLVSGAFVIRGKEE